MSLEVIIRQYVDNLESLRAFIDLVKPILVKANNEVWAQVFAEYIPLLFVYDAFCDPEHKIPPEELEEHRQQFTGTFELKPTDDGKSVHLRVVGGRSVRDYKAVWTEMGKCETQLNLLFRMSLISLVSATEWHLSRMIHQHFEKYPDAAPIKDKSLTFEELKDCDSIEAARQVLVEQVVDGVLRESFPEWLKFVKSRFGLEIKYINDTELAALVELFQRRNVIVHNSGIVNSTYLKRVAAQYSANLRAGQVLQVDHNYLLNAIAALEKAFLLMAFELWRNTSKDHAWAVILNEISFAHITAERWEIGEALTHFLKEDKKVQQEQCLIARINYWQCLKWQDGFEEVRAEVESFDVSALEVKYAIARAALLDDAEQVIRLSPEAIASKQMTKVDFLTWPLFRKLREDETFRKNFETDESTDSGDFSPPPR